VPIDSTNYSQDGEAMARKTENIILLIGYKIGENFG
jgi:hypothetical protein